jgi:hypothetical protein
MNERKQIAGRSPRNLQKLHRQEKRATCESKRPKSREETPKEGSDSARRYRTATICIPGLRSARVFGHFLMQKMQGFLPLAAWSSQLNSAKTDT